MTHFVENLRYPAADSSEDGREVRTSLQGSKTRNYTHFPAIRLWWFLFIILFIYFFASDKEHLSRQLKNCYNLLVRFFLSAKEILFSIFPLPRILKHDHPDYLVSRKILEINNQTRVFAHVLGKSQKHNKFGRWCFKAPKKR